MTAGTITSRLLGQADNTVFEADNDIIAANTDSAKMS